MITGNETQNIKKLMSYSAQTKDKNDNIIENLKMIEKYDPSSVDKILKDQITKISSLEVQYGNILKLLNKIESTVNDLVSRINNQEELDQQIIKCKPADNKKIFEALKDFTKKNIVGSTANNYQSKMQPIQALTNAFTKNVTIESQEDLSDFRDILISVIRSLKDVNYRTLFSTIDYDKFIYAVYDKVKSYIFKDINENDSIDNLVDGFFQKINLFNTSIISPIIDSVKGQNTILTLGKIYTNVVNEFYNRLREYEWNDTLIEKYKLLTKKHIDKLKKIPEQIRNNYSKWFADDFGIQHLMNLRTTMNHQKKHTEEVLIEKEIGKRKLPDILQYKNIKLNKQNNQENGLNINNVNLGLNNNDLPFENNNYKLQFQNQNHKEYLKLLELEKIKELYKHNKGNINNNQTRKGTRIVLKKIKLKK